MPTLFYHNVSTTFLLFPDVLNMDSQSHVRFDGRLDGRVPTTNLPCSNPVCIGIPGRYGRLLG